MTLPIVFMATLILILTSIISQNLLIGFIAMSIFEVIAVMILYFMEVRK